jgi:hypothetical protein
MSKSQKCLKYMNCSSRNVVKICKSTTESLTAQNWLRPQSVWNGRLDMMEGPEAMKSASQEHEKLVSLGL